MKGTVKWFDRDRGFGFIIAEDGTEYFCHISNFGLPAGQYPAKGQKVTFDVAPRRKGVEAVDVRTV